MENTKLYKINQTWARMQSPSLPMFFVARVMRETQRAVFLFGHGTLDTRKMGVCSICGRTLTHPVSVELGIGPECGQHYWDWDSVGGYSKENVERLSKTLPTLISINQWFPKSVIKEQWESTETIDVPETHPMLQPLKVETPVVNNSTPVVNTPTPSISVSLPAKRVELNGETLKIIFPYDTQLVAEVRQLFGRKYNVDGKYWTCPQTTDNIVRLKELGFTLPATIAPIVKESAPAVTPLGQPLNIPGLQGQLFPYQQEGVRFIEKKYGRALIADEMGLGKTVQALAWLQLHPEHTPVVIICPASLKLNWMKEAQNWMKNPSVQVLSGTTPYPITGNMVIINYDIVSEWGDALEALKPQVIVMDEVHYIKNNSALRTKAVKKLTKGVPYVLALSGTPIVNRPIEFYNIINIINRDFAPSRWEFAQRYCGAKNNGYGWDFSGATNTAELNERLTRSFMIRRLKVDVLPELPEKTYNNIPIQVENEKEYKRAEQDFITYLKQSKGDAAATKASMAETLVKIEVLKQLAAAGKLQQVREWVENFLSETSEKLVIMAVHKTIIDFLYNAFPNITVKIDGGVGNAQRQEAVEAFQNNSEIRLFIGNIKAAGVGLTLTAASTMAVVEYPWTPGELQQAEDRIHRIGQKDSKVMIYNLVAYNTVEMDIIKLIEAKRKVLNAVLDGKESTETSILHELLTKFKGD